MRQGKERKDGYKSGWVAAPKKEALAVLIRGDRILGSVNVPFGRATTNYRSMPGGSRYFHLQTCQRKRKRGRDLVSDEGYHPQLVKPSEV